MIYNYFIQKTIEVSTQRVLEIKRFKKLKSQGKYIDYKINGDVLVITKQIQKQKVR